MHSAHALASSNRRAGDTIFMITFFIYGWLCVIGKAAAAVMVLRQTANRGRQLATISHARHRQRLMTSSVNALRPMRRDDEQSSFNPFSTTPRTTQYAIQHYSI